MNNSDTNKAEPRIRIGVVIVQDENILLVRHKKEGKTYWLLPGGGLEYGESIDECAKREVMEETGLNIEMERLLFLSEAIAPDKRKHIINIYVLAKKTGGTIQKGEDIILDGVEFVNFAKLQNITLYPPIGKYLLNLKKNNYKAKGEIAYLGKIWQE